MIDIGKHTTLGEAFFAAAERFGSRPLLAVPANAARDYAPAGLELSYAEAAARVGQLCALYRAAGYGSGHRVALFLENRPEHLLHKLALCAIGACCVPMNAEHRPRELAYLVEHARVDLVLVLASRAEPLAAALALAAWQPAVATLEAFGAGPPPPRRAAAAWAAGADTPASILYTSGTTGRPKGCVLSHRYELASGAWYATRGGMAAIRQGQERLYNPLPLSHVNASVLSFNCMLLTGGCQIQSDRFQPSRWWAEVCQSEATVVHYLGVVVSMLMGLPAGEAERRHHVRFGFGAGVEPQLHAAFEQRFGFPLVELWGMTEIVRVLVDNTAPRHVGTRAFGRSVPGLEARVVDDAGVETAAGVAGELVVRHSEATPREDFFSGYLDDPAATEAAWAGGWFHTGDIALRGADGMLHFVDRRKNIVRRSGENIAAAEVEALLLSHPLVRQAAVLAVPDALREEEVLACVVLDEAAAAGRPRQALAQTLFDFCRAELAYYKAPGWLWFATEIPTTGTQKIQKHRIFPDGTDPRQAEGIFDLRAMKKRR